MEKFELNVNEKLEIISNNRLYKSLVIDIDDDENIKINIPVNEGEYLVLHTGETIEINMCLEGGNCYNFNAEVVSKGKEGNIPYYKLTEAFNIKRIQRRSYFRLDMLNHVYYRNINNSDSNEIPYSEALMVDLSASGVKLKVNEEIQKHDILLIKMRIKDSDIVVRGEVVRIEIGEDRKIMCGIKFLDITQAQIDIIIEELFEITRKRRALT